MAGAAPNGAEETRTPNFHLAKVALYQLSYRPGSGKSRGVRLDPARPTSRRHRRLASARPAPLRFAGMKCDLCDNEATVHETTQHSGVRVERHLCDQCAAQQGFAIQPSIGTPEILAKHLLTPALSALLQPGAAPTGRATACPRCGLTFAEFRQGGLLGCGECYRAFETQLGPMIERAHEHATHHVGKVPSHARPASGAPEAIPGTPAQTPPSAPVARVAPNPGPDPETVLRAERAKALKRQLAEAVQAEQYELAARLRDELRKLDDKNPPEGPKPQRAP